MGKIFFCGDSLTAGKWDSQGGWANRVACIIMAENIRRHETFECIPYVLGVPGNTLSDVTARLEAEVLARNGQTSSSQIVIAAGIKDALSPSTTEESFIQSLETLIQTAQRITPLLSFIGLFPTQAENDRVRAFDGCLAATCARHNLPFLPLMDMGERYTANLLDHVHPGDIGHAMIAERVKAFLLTPEFYARHKVG